MYFACMHALSWHLDLVGGCLSCRKKTYCLSQRKVVMPRVMFFFTMLEDLDNPKSLS
ncbi:hypothetical protein KP509_23G085000 [Ceratopteris richardii]|uniref:Uncharacterized protein n=1 Tax=Ceratopteris richardii TaxID=49495 RepID=A0A8T2S2L8_CERRI|nr:hypothetical protein KP509_23G085000 [Ceratopteris richardii]